MSVYFHCQKQEKLCFLFICSSGLFSDIIEKSLQKRRWSSVSWTISSLAICFALVTTRTCWRTLQVIDSTWNQLIKHNSLHRLVSPITYNHGSPQLGVNEKWNWLFHWNHFLLFTEMLASHNSEVLCIILWELMWWFDILH